MEGEGEAANHKLRVLLQWNLCAIKAVTYLHTVLKKKCVCTAFDYNCAKGVTTVLLIKEKKKRCICWIWLNEL